MGRGRIEDSGNISEDFIIRRSPRASVRKVKVRRGVNPIDVEPGKKRGKKRRATRYEDDPTYSDDQAVETDFDCQKKVAGYRCSAQMVADLMGKLSDKQRGWVKNIGFSSLVDLIGSRAPKSLTMWLVDRVDTEKGTIEVCGEHIDISKYVKRILGLPCGDKKVPQPLNGRSKAKIPKNCQDGIGEKHSDNGRGQTAKDATKLLLAENDDESSFCQSFVMLVLCLYLAPTTSLNINRSYYPAVPDVTQIALMDWCGFIAHYLVKGIEEYRNSKASHVQVPGCVHLLPLIYLDELVRRKALVFPPVLQLAEGVPLVHFVKSDHLEFLASADVVSKSKDRHEYGLLEKNLIVSKDASQKCGTEDVVPIYVNKMGVPDVESRAEERCSTSSDVMVQTEVLVNSLVKEIEDGRRQLFIEFEKKVAFNDSRTFDIFREKLKGILADNGRNNNDCGVSVRVGVENKTSVPEKMKDVGSNTANHDDVERDTVGIDEIEKNCHLNGTEEEMHAIVHEVPLSEQDVDLLPESMGVGKGESSTVSGRRMDNSDVIRGDEETVGNNAGKLLPEDEGNCRSFVDELNDVVKIGQDAAEEAVANDENTEAEENHGHSLKMLSQAANSQGAPRYDSSPRVESTPWEEGSESIIPLLFGDQNSTPDTYSLAGGLYRLKRPRFDDTPGSHVVFAKEPSADRCKVLAIVEDKQVSVTGPLDGFCSGTSSEQGVSMGIEKGGPESSNINYMAAVVADSYDADGDDSGDHVKSSEVLSAADPKYCYYKDPLALTPNFILTPGYSDMSQDITDIELLPDSPIRGDVVNVVPLQEEIESGFRFKFGYTMAGPTINLLGKVNQLRSPEESKTGSKTYKFVGPKEAGDTYKKHVSDFASRTRGLPKEEAHELRRKPEIVIKGFHLTKGELADALKPRGEVCQALMGLCSVAIMTDWENPKRIILDQGTMGDLMSDRDSFDYVKVARRLLKFQLEVVEEIFLPMLHSMHWILAVVNIPECKVEMCDSLILVDEGVNPHKELWTKIALNLEFAYCVAMKRTITIVDFPCEYQKVKLQTNTHDCGLHVIQAMECYKDEDIVGHEKKKSLSPYRKYLTHILMYHRFNDLNPLREGLPEDVA